ncbi:hypothetical protein Q1695_002107 [Nippostrongylus brasiliensis]|nr:hypothetical protein Q1695_002107 [Nippostrongylus brasiliensis]
MIPSVTSAIAFVVLLLITDVKCGDNHVPTLNEITRLNDPVLKEVFASSGIRNRAPRPDFEDNPRLPTGAPPQFQQQQPAERVYGEVPNNHNQPLGPIPTRPDPVQMAVDSGVNVLANGANALYREAASVGNAFATNTNTFASPLLSQFLG